MLRFAAVALSVVLLSGCASQPMNPYPGTDYTQVPQILLNVGVIPVDSEVAPAPAPSISQELQPTPENRLYEVLGQHYGVVRRAANGFHALRFIIKEASVSESVSEPTGGFFERTFSREADHHYTGRLVVDAHTEGTAHEAGFIHAEATGTLDMANASPADRNRMVVGMVNQMVDDIVRQHDQQINSNLGGYVISGREMSITPVTSGRWDHVKEDRVSRSAGMRVLTTR